ncbi:MAG: protein kinase [Muribaculaceae bacterium]|nr:protein kinase [Muribaculaceae bacterium]
MENNDKALRPGTVLQGKRTYRIERMLGAGGFGITYLASCDVVVDGLRMEGLVAIKEHFMSDHCNRGGDATSVVCPGTDASQALVACSLKDFVAEAGRLKEYGSNHSSIVKVNEIFEANGTAYYVMEYLKGQSLSDYIRAKGALGEDEIRALVYPVVDAAAYLHGKRVTHLDIKPGNIMLAAKPDGTVRPVLIDFGLSKHYNADGSATSTVNTMACSDGFAPLEQYKGIRTFSPAADVYALGATLYTAATGHNPATAGEFPFGEPAATIAALPLSERLRTAMTRAMADRAAERYPDAGALLAALGGSASVGTIPLPKPADSTKPLPKATPTPEPTPSAPSTRPNRKGLIIGAAIAAVVIILLSGLGISSYIDYRQERERQELAAAPRERMRQYATPHNLDLAVRGANGQTYYFNQNNWQSLMQPGDEKLGVVIIKDGQRFILALEDLAGGQKMNWNNAMSRYGNRLPTKEQGEAWVSQRDAVRDAVRAYGGHHPSPLDQDSRGNYYWYWTKTEDDSSYAWGVNSYYSYVYTYSKPNTYRVRAVAPVPSSAI